MENKQEYVKISLSTYNEMLLKNHEYDLVQQSIKITLEENQVMNMFLEARELVQDYKDFKKSAFNPTPEITEAK